MGQVNSRSNWDDLNDLVEPRRLERVSIFTIFRSRFERMPKHLLLHIMSFLPEVIGFYTFISISKDIRGYILKNYEPNRLIFPLNNPKTFNPNLDLSFVTMISMKYHCPESHRRLYLFPNLRSIHIHGIELTGEDFKSYLQLKDVPILLDSKRIIYVKDWQGYQYGNLSIPDRTQWNGEEDGNEMKIFMFGIEGVGKGTIFRHLDSLLGNKSLQHWIPYILHNIWKISIEVGDFYFSIVKRKTKTFKQEKLHRALKKIKTDFKNFCHFDPSIGMTNEIYECILSIWSDDAIRRLYDQIKFDHLSICDGFENLLTLDSLLRLDPNHMCLYEQDMLFLKKKTTGVTKIKFQDQKRREYIFGYVGGEQSERRKWNQLYPNLNRYCFVVSLVDYCRVSPETSKNRLVESLEAFDESICGETLKQHRFFLIFTKIDVLQECLDLHPLKKYFPKYQGECLQDALDFMRDLFVNRTNIKPERFSLHYISGFSSIDINDLLDSLVHNPSVHDPMENEENDDVRTDDVYYF